MFLIRDKSHLVVHDGCAIAYFPDVSLACISPVQEGPKYTIARAPSDLPQSLSSRDKEQSWIEILVAFAKSFLRSAPNHFASLADTSEARLVSRRATWVSRALPYHPRPFARTWRGHFLQPHIWQDRPFHMMAFSSRHCLESRTLQFSAMLGPSSDPALQWKQPCDRAMYRRYATRTFETLFASSFGWRLAKARQACQDFFNR